MKFFSICLLWLCICNLTYSMDRNTTYTNDELQSNGQNNFRYPQGIDPSFFLPKQVKLYSIILIARSSLSIEKSH